MTIHQLVLHHPDMRNTAMPTGALNFYLKAIPAVLILFLLPLTKANAQSEIKSGEEQYSLLFRGASMESALEELVRETQLDLVYSNELIEGKRVFCSKKDAQVEELLRCILGDSGLDFIRSSAGTYILIGALQQKPLYGDLAGSITDLETGAPLPYANILLADGSSGTTTNQDGFFAFKSLISGFQRVVITYVGYETSVDSIWVQPGERSRINIELKSSETSVGPIVIDGLEQKLPSQRLGGYAVQGAGIMGMSSLGTPDVMRGASKLAGISIQQPVAGLQIQGGLSNEHVTLLDGVPVRDPVTLGRYLGAFSPLAVKRLTVHKAGYGVQHGSHLTGVVAIDQDVDTIEPYSASLMLDPVSINGQIKSRFGLKNGREGVLMGAVRTSNWNVYQDRSVQSLLENWNNIDPFLTSLWSGESVTPSTLNKHSQTPLVSFSDIHFASRLNLTPFHKLQGSVYRASNRIESDLIATNDLLSAPEDLFVITNDRYSWLNWAGHVKHSWLLGSRSALSTQLKGSWHNSRYSYRASNESIDDTPSPSVIIQKAIDSQEILEAALSSSERNFIRELTINTTLSHSFSPFHHADFGLEATHVTTDFFYKSAFVDTIRHDITTSNIAGFFHDQIAINAYTSIEPGIRLTYLPMHQTAYAEPRLALRYDDISSKLGSYALRLAGGIYRQFINQYDLTSFGTTSAAPSILFWLPLDKTVSPPRAYHVAFDALVIPGPKWTVGFEAYMKWQQVLTLDYANLQQFESPADPLSSTAQNQFLQQADGESYGVSIQAERKGSIFQVSAGYDFTKATQQFPDRFGNEMVAVPWNTPNRISIDTKTKLSNSFSIEANWTSQWGREWALRRAYYDFIAFRSIPLSLTPFDLNDPSAHQVPFYQRLDIGATLSLFANRVKSDIQFFVLNVLDRDNVYDQLLTPSSIATTTSNRTLPGRQFTLSIRVDY